MYKKILVVLLMLSALSLSACSEEEDYTPIKKTGYDAPPLEIVISEDEEDSSPEEDEEAWEEEELPLEEEANPEPKFDDFERDIFFGVTEYEVVCREYPDIDSYILSYFYDGDLLRVVDKVMDSDGDYWYVVELFDHGYTYGFTLASGVELYSY